MDANIMNNNPKYKVGELSSSSDSSSKSINEFKISIASAKEESNTNISKLGSLGKRWRSSEDAVVKVGCTPEEESILTVKA